MHEQTTQLRIITALLVVVIALAGGLFFYRPLTQTTSADQPYQHIKLREAQISLDPALIYEQTLGSSGDDSLIDIFESGDNLILFGNSGIGYDFDNAGGFMVKMNKYGKIESIVEFKDTLCKVTIYGTGFLLAFSSLTVKAVDCNGNIAASYTMTTGRTEELLDLVYLNGDYGIVTALSNTLTGFTKLKLTVLTDTLTYRYTIVTDETYSLSYIATLDVSGVPYLMASALSDMRNMRVFGQWGEKLAYYPLDFSYLPMYFWIDKDFVFLSKTNSGSTVICEYTVNLEGNPTGIFAQNGYIYAATDHALYIIKNGEVLKTYDPATLYFDGFNLYSVSSHNGRTAVRSFYDDNKGYECSFSYELSSPRLFTCSKGMFVIGYKTVYGGSDIVLIKIDY